MDFAPELEAAAQKYKSAIKSAIESSPPPPDALSTASEKGHGRTLIDTGAYLDSIDYELSENGFVVAPNDPDISKIASYHEHGTKTAPPRPVWGPVADGPGEVILRELREAIADKLISIL